ncbi:MAG TPA: thioredoxin domain-containing protein [Gemmatimonadaceae bacterium]|nr:thioredoxin domain-containing protein [Gemmatimonadaceae bacterium]
MSIVFERAISGTLAIAAIVIAGSTFHREFASPPPAGPTIPKPEYVRDWRAIANAGIRDGDSAARIQVIEFADFQCPFCAQYEQTLRAFQKEHRGQVARVFVHFPLTIHRFARSAARAAECAAAQGRFPQMQTALYAKQDSFGLRPWSAYGADAAVTDSVSFAKCAADSNRLERIEQGIALANKLKVYGTPAVIINGWKFMGGPPDSILARVADRLLAGKSPADVVRP